MLEQLDVIPWADLEDARGNVAVDVPRLVRQVLSAEESTQITKVVDALSDRLCDGGFEIGPATAYAVPFLIELVQTPAVPGKEQLLQLLYEIVSARPLLGWDWNAASGTLPVLDAALAVTRGVPAYTALLDAPEGATRMGAANLLFEIAEYAPERVHDIWPTLVAALEREKDEGARANLVLALGFVAAAAPKLRPFLIDLQQSGQGRLETFVAALMIARWAKQNTSSDILLTLAAALLYRPPALVRFDQLGWGTEDLHARLMEALLEQPSARLQFMVPLLEERIAALANTTAWQVLDFARLLVQLRFPSRATLLPPTELTAPQRTVLVLLLRCDQLWEVSNLVPALSAGGLPVHREELAAFVRAGYAYRERFSSSGGKQVGE